MAKKIWNNIYRVISSSEDNIDFWTQNVPSTVVLTCYATKVEHEEASIDSIAWHARTHQLASPHYLRILVPSSKLQSAFISPNVITCFVNNTSRHSCWYSWSILQWRQIWNEGESWSGRDSQISREGDSLCCAWRFHSNMVDNSTLYHQISTDMLLILAPVSIFRDSLPTWKL